MDKTFLQLIELVRRVIKDDKSELNKELFPDMQDISMWKAIYNLAVQQEVQVFLHEATKDFDIPETVRKNFYSVYNRAVRKEAIVHLEVSKYFEELDKAGIAYIPIKGWNLKNLYQKPYLRTMTDVDLIVRGDCFDEACQLMLKCGFELDVEGENHHVFIKKPVTEVEVHHQLFSKHSVSYQWGQSVLKKNNYTSMNDEDAYIYLLAHMVKHLTKEGAGMRNVIDYYLFRQKYSFDESQQEYIARTLKEIGLDVFEKRIHNISEVWFEGAAYEPESEMIAEYIMDGGLYGKLGNGGKLAVNDNSGSKLKWIIKEIFPDFESLKLSLGYKKMYKILTPVYWIIRAVRVLFHRRRIEARIIVMGESKEGMEKVNQLVESLGLNSINY